MKLKPTLKSKKGIAFTLIELIVVVAIIAVLATLIISGLNIVRMKGRDTQRVSHMNTINQALQSYYKDHGYYPATLNFGQTFRNSDNTKTYIDEVPQNPSPRTDHNCPDREYIYTVSTDKKEYSLVICTNKQGDPNKPSLVFSSQEGIFHCGDLITDLEENTYKTIAIGTQCWMAQNLKTKLNPDGSCIMDGSNPPCPEINPLSGERRRACTGFLESNCTLTYPPPTASIRDGAFYMWDAAMNGSTTEGARGICPTGWHIPSDNEWYILESYLTNPGQTCDPTRLDPVFIAGIFYPSCVDAGTKLRYPGGSSGFNALFAGYYGIIGGSLQVHAVGSIGRFISSTDNGIGSSTYIMRQFWPGYYSNLWRSTHVKNFGASLRCIRD